uniref:TSA: Wollemia nobilis Ref_Wollemi_Transcript_19138_1020 transcribed RNA sequence n=1 Tax=Wollemia nobilis TaxID=56998 RepID=A0A0C9RI02_9CONI
MASTEGAAPPAVAKEKKPRAPKGSKPAPSHPTYLQMIAEAITTLKERNGSSHYAIANFIDGKYKSKLPANYKKLLTGQLRKLAKSGKLTKVKGSFKLSAEAKKPVKPKPVKAAKAVKAPVKKPASAKPKAKPKSAVKKVAAKPKAAAKPAAKVAKVPKVPKEKKPAVPAAAKKVEKPAAKKVAAPKKAAPATKPVKKPAKKAAAPKPKSVKKTPKKVKK